MEVLEAISKISLLLADLIQRAKDKPTLSLVQQIQTYQIIVDTELKKRASEIEERDAEIKKMVERIIELETQLKKPKTEMFIPRMFGKSTYY